MMARHTTIIFRLPYMSALRETIGVATALESSVAVTSQEASSARDAQDPGEVRQQRHHQGLHQGHHGAAEWPGPP